jgi:hypothetical protein
MFFFFLFCRSQLFGCCVFASRGSLPQHLTHWVVSIVVKRGVPIVFKGSVPIVFKGSVPIVFKGSVPIVVQGVSLFLLDE